MVARLMMVAALALALSGCQTASNCAGWKPVSPSRSDKLTAGTRDQILEHNEYGARQGCWEAR